MMRKYQIILNCSGNTAIDGKKNILLAIAIKSLKIAQATCFSEQFLRIYPKEIISEVTNYFLAILNNTCSSLAFIILAKKSSKKF